MTRRFWVYIEQEDGKAHPVSWELLGVARRLADEVNDNAVVEGILVGAQHGRACQGSHSLRRRNCLCGG